MAKVVKDNTDLKRLLELEKEHQHLFGECAERFFTASGRTELGGNHTDHNLGIVLCGAINLDTLACASPNTNNTVTLYSRGFEPISIDISDLEIKPEEKGTTKALVRGVAASIVKRGGTAGGFSANIESLVAAGSGLSSSASVEVLFGQIFSGLFNNDRFTTTELAQIGQEAENLYFGKPCGLMDQIGCANGGVVMIDFKDINKPVITSVETDFEKYGYNLVIVNTGSGHANLTEDYAAIPSDMKQVAAVFGKNYLREVNSNDFYQEKQKLISKTSQRAVNRAQHFFDENERVLLMTQALKEGNFEKYLDLVKASGKSSENLLCNILANGETGNRLSTALEIAGKLLKGHGAYRVHGGGFAGTIQAYVPLEETEHFISHMNRYMESDCCVCLRIRNCGVGEVLL